MRKVKKKLMNGSQEREIVYQEAEPGHKWSNMRVTAILRIYTTTKKSYTRENGTAAWRRNLASSNWET